MALIELRQKTAGVRELREVVKRYPGSDEDPLARAKLKELGVAVAAMCRALILVTVFSDSN